MLSSNRCLRLIAALVSTCSCSATLFAAPAVTAVSISGSQATVSGSGFGSRASQTPRHFDFVSNQLAYSSLDSGDAIPVGSSTPYIEAVPAHPGSVRVATDSPRSTDSPKYYRTTNYVGWVGWPYSMGGKGPPATQREIYATFWFRPDGDIDSTSHSSKFFRIWDNPSGLGTRISWTQMHLTYPELLPDGTVTNEGSNWATWGGVVGQWNRLEIYVNADKGVIQAWTNGSLRHNVTNFRKSASYESVGLTLGLAGWDRGGSSPPDVNSSFGELYVDATRARVELCDQPDWANCRRKELQPSTSWSDGSITFSLRRGAFSSSVPLYVYVVDNNGVASSKGFLVGSTADPPPQPPSSFVIE